MRINVTNPSLPSFDEYCEEIKDIWNNKWLTNNGPKHIEFENQLKKYLHNDNIALFTNGHSALEATIEIFNFPKGSEIITTPFTFVSTTNAIIRNGMIPVFCDVKKNDYTIDEGKIEGLITKKTVAILAVHVYGNICNVERIQQIADKYNLRVIYDAAHAFGVKYKDYDISLFGDVTMFSFHATKVFNTIEGGAVCFKDAQLKDKFEAIKNFGINAQTGEYLCAGKNAKMNEFQACMGICNLRHVDEYISSRKNAFETYYSELNNVNGIELLKFSDSIKSNYSYFPCVFDSSIFNLESIISKLNDNSIQVRRYFYPCTNVLNKLSNGNETPIAKELSNRVICLPLYPNLNIEDIKNICQIIRSCSLQK